MKKFFLLSVVIFLITGCGGGGSSSNTKENPSSKSKSPDKNQIATIDKSNANSIAISAFNEILKNIILYDKIVYNDDMISKTNNKQNFKIISKSSKKTTPSRTFDCETSGTKKVTGYEDDYTIEFNQCQEDEKFYNGKITYSNNGVEIQSYDNFEYKYKDLTFKMKSGTYYAYYDYHDKIVSLYGSIKVGEIETEYFNFNYDNDGGISIDGWIKNNCLDKWVHIKTTKKLLNEDGLMSKGEVKISGKESNIVLSFNIEKNDYILKISGLKNLNNKYYQYNIVNNLESGNRCEIDLSKEKIDKTMPNKLTLNNDNIKNVFFSTYKTTEFLSNDTSNSIIGLEDAISIIKDEGYDECKVITTLYIDKYYLNNCTYNNKIFKGTIYAVKNDNESTQYVFKNFSVTSDSDGSKILDINHSIVIGSFDKILEIKNFYGEFEDIKFFNLNYSSNESQTNFTAWTKSNCIDNWIELNAKNISYEAFIKSANVNINNSATFKIETVHEDPDSINLEDTKLYLKSAYYNQTFELFDYITEEYEESDCAITN
jgi:hypothetical protein